MKPRLSILDRRFKYRSAANTDVRRTWRRARLLERMQAGHAETTVVSITSRKAAK